MPISSSVRRASGGSSYICASDSKQESNHNIAANMLILDAEGLCLQGADRDSEGEDKVEEA